ncbi:hypothetical protein D5S17_25195 [Pseudonocardiaceae bacterium YIM PH 21723]|nr:hypothetical protein D5S17_25195 [Pseudonocardiaceae bacterium YIM PH 21723]
MGETVTDAEGFTLYRFDKDTPNPPKSNCNGACATTWPPVLSDGPPALNGIDAALVGTVIREDGKKQVTIGGWPVYRFAKDPKPGAWKGQGVMGTWFVVAPDGKKNLSCLPPQAPAAAAPVPAPAAAPAGGSGGGTQYKR